MSRDRADERHRSSNGAPGDEPVESHRARPWALAFAMLGSGLAWALHLAMTYTSVPTLCVLELGVVLHAFTAALFVLAALAGIVGWRLVRGHRRRGEPGKSTSARDQPVRETDRYLGGAAIVLSVLFATTILFQGAPGLGIDPCAVVP